jgi:S1-C subfamily serine protease
MNRVLCCSIAALLLAAGSAHAGGAFLGVVPHSVDEDVAEDLGYKGKGVFVAEVVEGSPAEAAGIEDEDIIVELAGDKLVGPGHLRDVLALHSPGDKVTVKVWRDGKTQALPVELGEAKKIEKVLKSLTIKTDEPKAWLGIKMQGLTEQLAEYFGVEGGALVSEVFEDSPAEKAGIKAGDVITELDGETAEDPSDLADKVGDEEPGTKVSLTLVRGGTKLTKEVELGEVPEEHRKTLHFGAGPWLPGLEGLAHLKHLEALKDLEIEIPEIEIEIEEDMEELREELEELREELEELRETVQEKSDQG